METPEGLLEIMDIIQEINEDSSVPRNIKKILSDVKDGLNSTAGEFKLRVDAAIQAIEELSLNQNLPSHTRTHVWNISSVLEDLSQL